jgi:hypothetical protein
MKGGRHSTISIQPHTIGNYQIYLAKDIAAQYLYTFVTSAHLPIELSNQLVARNGERLIVHVKRYSHDILSHRILRHCCRDQH